MVVSTVGPVGVRNDLDAAIHDAGVAVDEAGIAKRADFFFFSSRRRHTRSVSAFLLNRSSDLTSFSHSTRNKTRDGLIRVRNIRALNGRFNTSITHAYSIVIGSKHITLNATGGGFLTASKQFRHGATSKSRSNTASNSTK